MDGCRRNALYIYPQLSPLPLLLSETKYTMQCADYNNFQVFYCYHLPSGKHLLWFEICNGVMQGNIFYQQLLNVMQLDSTSLSGYMQKCDFCNKVCFTRLLHKCTVLSKLNILE